MGDIMAYVGLGLSLLINVVAISSIGITAWRHRQSLMSNLGQSSRRTQVEKILILVIESSLLYCLANVILTSCRTICLPGHNPLSQHMWPISTHIAASIFFVIFEPWHDNA
ncbi:hypothetical protein HETIRDRAFT_416899 [Heterobasidion irregulare TC 32-1]|uniref:Uncharacterized protein n=1 Tax=Heterobasidion irregulare (strain TC 32-1) TaxID=747525 RepID=W4KC01_HETIT|nr:uncharacterized protein HETIRDRAFT_416899 [Heterobasidion irregulare TC 32-1]ETW82860.1 hypothetical protein HETIRDRAFT_416899 [Heterobasidion irregulare TC 32-1]